MPHIPKFCRYTLAVKIDDIFLELIESISKSIYSNRAERYFLLKTASEKLDSLKLFLQIMWEMKYLDGKKYATVSIPLAEVGKMIGGWKKRLV